MGAAHVELEGGCIDAEGGVGVALHSAAVC